MKLITVSKTFFFKSLSIVGLKSVKSECVRRWRCRTWRALSSCSSPHHTFCVTPSCPLLQGSKCCNKPWMNKVLFLNMYAIKFEWMAARAFPMAVCILDACKMTGEDQRSRRVGVPTYEQCAQAILVQQRAPPHRANNARARNGIISLFSLITCSSSSVWVWYFQSFQTKIILIHIIL